jgi:hypothetical protein
MTDIVLAAIIILPFLITLFLQCDAAMGFLALCVGFVLSTSVIGDLKHLLSETDLSVTSDTLAILMLILPYFLTLLIKGKAHSKGPLLFANLAAALLGGGLLALAAAPLLHSSDNFNIMDSDLWTWLVKYQSAVIGLGAFLSLVIIWLGPTRHKKH